jgi:hypothetical protein
MSYEKQALLIGSGLLTIISGSCLYKNKNENENKPNKFIIYNLFGSSLISFSYSLFRLVKK